MHQGIGMFGISAKSLDAIGDQLLKASDILIWIGKNSHFSGDHLPVPASVPQSSLRKPGGIFYLL